MLQCGLSPGGATLALVDDSSGQLRVGYDSFDLMFSVHRRLNKYFWLSAGAGWSGFGSFSINGSHTNLKVDLDRSPMWTVRLALRPPKPTIPEPAAGK
jgi:hypothetical protein